VGGTAFYVEKTYEAKNPERSFAYKKKANREMIKCMVQDLKNRGTDPLEYFSKNQEKTQMILDLPAAKASELALQYQKNLDLYGQIATPKEGEKSAKELMDKKGTNKQGKEDEKRLKAEAKAKAAAEKAHAKAKAKEEKLRAAEEKKAAKEAAKKEKEAAKLAAASAALTADTSPADPTGTIAPSGESDDNGDSGVGDSFDSSYGDEETEGAVMDEEPASTVSKESKLGGINIIPAAGAVIAVGGGAYAFKTMREKSAAAEEERQRQFKLLMGEVEKDVADTNEAKGSSAGDTMSDLMFEYENETERDEAPKPAPVEPQKKKRRGIKSVFMKKKNDRETDIAVLVSPDAKAPEFATTLAKILTFGAPGRFPEVVELPGEMPLEEFDLEKASDILVAAQESAGITREESAEIFANVVNCMLIDIVDLASTSLKEKDDKITADAVGIVVDFMDLAASLYSSIADGVVITPVTYGGDVSKGKLEQMFSTYAVSGMMDIANADENSEKRMELLQDVFQISPKKAEGLLMKAMQKNMMEMMKDPEKYQEMMQGMEGLGDMGGFPGMDGEDPDPEQLKMTLNALKEMKDSGSIPEENMAEVKAQFKELFGAGIEELVKQAEDEDEADGTDKELLELMKYILS